MLAGQRGSSQARLKPLSGNASLENTNAFDYADRFDKMTHISRWNWFVLLAGFVVVYAALTWADWVPLDRGRIGIQNGVSYVPFWEGEVIGFVVIRIAAVVLLSLFCCVLPSPAHWRNMLVSGSVSGLLTSLFDRLEWNWVQNHLGFLVALFGIPLVTSGAVMIFVRSVKRRRSLLG